MAARRRSLPANQTDTYSTAQAPTAPSSGPVGSLSDHLGLRVIILEASSCIQALAHDGTLAGIVFMTKKVTQLMGNHGHEIHLALSKTTFGSPQNALCVACFKFRGIVRSRVNKPAIAGCCGINGNSRRREKPALTEG